MLAAAGAVVCPDSDRDWPLPFVIKTSHASGGNIFVRERPDWNAIEGRLKTLLRHRHGQVTGELYYLRVPPRVLIEPMIDGDNLPPDYKFWVVGGKVQFINVDQNREHGHRRVFYTPAWERLTIYEGKSVGVDHPAPRQLAKMIEIAEALGSDFGFVRVDLYEVEGSVYFGELTLTPGAGYGAFTPREIDVALGARWPDDLP